ncbi:flagellar protein FlgN [Glutamicibacter nicotianae]|uniref:flagellar protein FlgN n=1 Tax=Glutamicibacter nicotianae TaxID=37929 RepID=UPI001FC9D596|nr:flagellar protein FlgN [Glutamicibacter nicotianae]
MAVDWGIMTTRINDLSALLFKEREILDLLRFKLEEQRLLLISGKTQWISRASAEIEQVLDSLHHASLERSMVAQAVAKQLGAATEATLAELADLVPNQMWGEILRSHLQALRELAASIAGIRDSNDEHLRAALRSAQESLANLGTSPATYGPDSTPKHDQPGARILDTNL